MRHYSVILRSCPHELLYSGSEELRLGSLVSVPFRKGISKAIIRSVVDADKEISAKKIDSVIQNDIIEKWRLDLVAKISEYYFCSINQALRLFFPSFLWSGKEPKREMFVTRSEGVFDRDSLKRSRKQAELVTHIESSKKLRLSDVRKTFSSQTVKQLLSKKIIQLSSGHIVPGFVIPLPEVSPDKNLTGEQHNILSTIIHSPGKKFLVHGITGSGKTEIYLRLAQEMRSKNKGCIILVPEIALTTQLIQYFSSCFQGELAVFHSRMTDQERLQEWWRLKNGEAHVLLSSRSGLFAPVQNLGLIVVDEEHEWTYKQENAPRYHARKVAEMMQELQPDITLVLGSATPDICTYHRTLGTQSDYTLLELTKRISESGTGELPNVDIVDLRDEFKKRNYSIFSDSLREALTETLANHEQAILFLNRRGSASSVMCRECGFSTRCEQCDIPMTLHTKQTEASGVLVCHHCGSLKKPPVVCPKCRSANIRNVGIGTERVEYEIKKLFPNARVLRADRDTTDTKKGFETIYHTFQNHEADILIGTQMVAKGLDIPKVSLVGVILADIGLHIPDFRSSEKTFQLLTQVAGRAGRREKRGNVIIQTYSPTHPAVIAASHHDYQSFYTSELKERQDFGYPPFSSILKLTFTHRDKGVCFRTASHLHELLVKLRDDVQALSKSLHETGPKLSTSLAPAAIPRLHSQYRWNLFLEGDGWDKILRGIQLERGWKIDRDPINMS